MTETKRLPTSAEAPAGLSPEPSLVVRLSTAADDARRDEFVRGQPDATPFHLAGWRRAIERVYGHEPVELVAWREDRMVGVLPLMACRSMLGRENLVSMPYAVYGGALAEDREVRDGLHAEAERIARERGVGHLELRYASSSGLDWPSTDLYVTFIKELPEDPSEVLGTLPKKARAEARKARNRHGLELTGGEWYVDDLYRLFLLNKRQLGSPGLPVEHFHTVLDELGDCTHVHLVRRQREPVAAVMSFGVGDTLIAYYAGTAVGADRAHSASNYMYMALQEWAVASGYRRFDFCRSRVDSGACGFKKRQGFEPIPLDYRYLLVKDRSIPSFTPSNPRTRILRSAWSRLPHWAARPLSDRLARYLP